MPGGHRATIWCRQKRQPLGRFNARRLILLADAGFNKPPPGIPSHTASHRIQDGLIGALWPAPISRAHQPAFPPRADDMGFRQCRDGVQNLVTRHGGVASMQQHHSSLLLALAFGDASRPFQHPDVYTWFEQPAFHIAPIPTGVDRIERDDALAPSGVNAER